MEKSIEFYKEHNQFCVWLAGENESGMKFCADTIEELAEKVKNHIIDNAEDLFI